MTGAAHDANDLDAILDDSVQDQMIADRVIAQLGGDVRTGRTHQWIVGEQPDPATSATTAGVADRAS